MSRPQNSVPPVSKEITRYLSDVYSDEFIRDFIVDLMNEFIKNKPKKWTPNEQILFQHLQNIELNNSLLWKFTVKEIKAANKAAEIANKNAATQRGENADAESEANIQDLQPIAQPPKPPLYLTNLQKGELTAKYNEIVEKAKKKQSESKQAPAPNGESASDEAQQVLRARQRAKATLCSTLPRYSKIESAAYAVAKDGQSRSSSPLTKSILSLMTTTYGRQALVEHIDEMNAQQIMTNGAIQGVRTQLDTQMSQQQQQQQQKHQQEIQQQQEQIAALQKQNEDLNTSLLSVNASFSEERGRNKQLNETLGDLRGRYDNLNRSMQGGNGGLRSLNSSFASTHGDEGILPSPAARRPSATSMGGNALGGLGAPSNVVTIQKHVGERWACIAVVTEALKGSQPEDAIHSPLQTLLQQLLMPSKTSENDTMVEEWLKQNDGQLSPDLKGKLEGFKTLSPFRLADNKKESYFQAVAYCFNKGEFFPKIRELAATFNSLRPSKTKASDRKETKAAESTSSAPTTGPGVSS